MYYNVTYLTIPAAANYIIYLSKNELFMVSANFGYT